MAPAPSTAMAGVSAAASGTRRHQSRPLTSTASDDDDPDRSGGVEDTRAVDQRGRSVVDDPREVRRVGGRDAVVADHVLGDPGEHERGADRGDQADERTADGRERCVVAGARGRG